LANDAGGISFSAWPPVYQPFPASALYEGKSNLSYGAIITVRTGPEEGIDALTDDGIDELASMLAHARQTDDQWMEFLQDFVADPEIIETVKNLKPR
jgi:hypothetical protein